MALILYIDDDAEDREMFASAVRSIDSAIAILQFASCPKALDYLFSTSVVPDYVFIDYNMPKINGIECVRQIKAKPHLSTAQLVLYSTSFSPGLIEELGNYGVTWVIKEADFSGIVGSIQSIIATGSVHR